VSFEVFEGIPVYYNIRYHIPSLGKIDAFGSDDLQGKEIKFLVNKENKEPFGNVFIITIIGNSDTNELLQHLEYLSTIAELHKNTSVIVIDNLSSSVPVKLILEQHHNKYVSTFHYINTYKYTTTESISLALETVKEFQENGLVLVLDPKINYNLRILQRAQRYLTTKNIIWVPLVSKSIKYALNILSKRKITGFFFHFNLRLVGNQTMLGLLVLEIHT